MRVPATVEDHRMRSWLRRVGRAVASRVVLPGLVLTLSLAGPATAQESNEGVAPLESKKPAIEWTIGTVFLAGCLVVAFKNARRTHLD